MNWSKRPRASSLVADDETFASILDDAAASLDVVENNDWSLGWGTGRFLALRSDESPIPLEDRFWRWPTVLDENGLARWDEWDFTRITFAQIRDAAATGAIEGDPAHIYLNVRLVPAGGGVLTEWHLFTQAWDAAWYVLERAAAAWGTFELYRGTRERLRGRRSVDRHIQDWLSRNGWPINISRMLDGRPWQARNLAGVLGCTTSESEDILRLYGYALSVKPDRWIYAAGGLPPGADAIDPSARLSRLYIKQVMWHYSDSDVSDETLRDLFRTVFQQSLDTDHTDDSS